MGSRRWALNALLVIIVLMFLVVGVGVIALYNTFNGGRQTASSPAAMATATRFAAAPPAGAPSNAGCTNNSDFVADMTVPDNSVLAPRQEFDKVWRIKNSGTCVWNSNYRLVFVDGTRMGAPADIPVPDTAPGATADIQVKLTAPQKAGRSAGRWQIQAPSGERFGATFDTTIRVAGPGARVCNGSPVIESFAASPTTIAAGQSSTLSWGLVSNADAAEIDNSIGGVATPGSMTVSPTRTTKYTLTARCGQNVSQAEITIVVP